jgi:hypothetical protein
VVLYVAEPLDRVIGEPLTPSIVKVTLPVAELGVTAAVNVTDFP